MRRFASKKGSPGWRRGVERARAQAVALLKRIGPNADRLTDEERREILKELVADLQRLVRAIDRHLAEVPPEASFPSLGRTPKRGRRLR